MNAAPNRQDNVELSQYATPFRTQHPPLHTLLRNQPVTVITDALGSHEKGAAEIALRKMQAKGARLVDTRSLLGNSRLRQVHVCNCERCRGLLQKATLSA